jgi:23S rRNA (cytidine1920-2'-O)/16S rRNA (cytidine1409-2'-O)-methyltransferase
VRRTRLDEALVARGLYASRSRARDAILRGTVWVDGHVATKPSQSTAESASISIADPARHYVSRAALKLLHALDRFAISPEGRSCLDIGASTGGFTQVLLERGARHVTAVDVGHGQMVDKIARDPRVTNIEGLNAREISLENVREQPELIVCDASFISLKLVLPAALDLAAEGAGLIALIKPQFEAGREALSKTGLVTDPAMHWRICHDVSVWLKGRGWQVKGLVPSPIEGADGNKEFLIAAEKTP